MTLAIHSATRQTPAAPCFREKDAVCIEARAVPVNAAPRPVEAPSFQYQLADMLIAAQLQAAAPAVSASGAAYAYLHTGAAAAASSMHGLRV